MNFIIDTHCWLWWHSSPDKLNEESLKLISNHKNNIFFSAVCSWEIAIKFLVGKIRLPEPPQKFIPKSLREDGFSILPVELIHTLQLSNLPMHHKDPFDRLLISQAQVEKLPILTADNNFNRYEVDVIPARE